MSAFEGKEFVFSGRLAAMNRLDATKLVRRLGGTCAPAPGPRTAYVVVGGRPRPLDRHGAPDARIAKAIALRDEGAGIRIISEGEFLAWVVPGDQTVHRHFNVFELHRLLDVSGASIRAWLRSGLIAPVLRRHGLDLFDFAQVAEARALKRLVRSGVPLAQIRKGLERLRQRVPSVDRPLSRQAAIARRRELLIRLDDGRLSDTRGQLYFDFVTERAGASRSATGRVAPLPLSMPRSAEQCLVDGFHHEADGDLDEAERAYRRAIELDGPRALLCFNLGNVYYEQDRFDRALESYALAVELEPDYAEAWNNLGNVLGEFGEARGAIGAYYRALEIAPNYATALYNIAEAHLEIGEREQARCYWERYLEYDATSAWAATARERLRQIDAAD